MYNAGCRKSLISVLELKSLNSSPLSFSLSLESLLTSLTFIAVSRGCHQLTQKLRQR